MKNTSGKISPEKSFVTMLLVPQTPQEVFEAINHVRGWWSESIEGITDQPEAEFLQYYRDIHIAKIKIVEFIPGEKVSWQVLDSYFSFTTIDSEWTGTKICFAISRQGDETQLLFTHLGLVPQYQCYDVCNDAWSQLITISLRGLITNGKGHPNPREDNSFNPQRTERWKLPGDKPRIAQFK